MYEKTVSLFIFSSYKAQTTMDANVIRFKNIAMRP